MLTLPLALLAATAMSPSQTVSRSAGPDPAGTNRSYQGNRQPLAGAAFIKLPVGSIEPKGWLLECLKRQRAGLCGNLGKISAWLVKEHNAWLSKDGKGEWGWEEVPYWLKGYGNLGYILHDPAMISEAKVWLESVLSSQRAGGDFGPISVDDKGAEDFWPKMIMLYCLQSHFEYSGDRRVLDFMSRFFRYQLAYPEDKFLKQYWQSRRVGDNLHSVLWLYNRTGEPWLLDLARKIHRCGVNWRPQTVSPDHWFDTLPDWHNVNIAQGFREPALFSQVSHDPEDVRASYDAFRAVRRYFGQVPGGMFGADENARPGYDDPRQAVETCGMVEQMNSDEEMLRITGDPFWADHCEDVAFNTYPAAIMPDYRALRYLTSPNMVLNDDKNHHPGIGNSGPFLMMNPFSSRCCQHNHSQGWPYFSENLWQATADNGLAAVIYAANSVSAKVGSGVPVQIELRTNYPFDDRLDFHLHLAGRARFPLYLRIPAWCSKPVLTIDGKNAGIGPGSGAYLKIDREWRDGEVLTMRLPMSISLRTWEKNKNSVSVDYGPLTFSLKIAERYVRNESTKTAVWDARWQKGADSKSWPSFEIHPASAWNYGLIVDGQPLKLVRKPWPKSDFPFTLEDCPIELRARARRIPEWKIDQYGLCGLLPQSPVDTSEPAAEVTLVPMGAARLRISAFPTVK